MDKDSLIELAEKHGISSETSPAPAPSSPSSVADKPKPKPKPESKGTENTAATALPPNDFLCPITQHLMEHPVTTVLGNTYEYAAVSKWLKKSSNDPITNEPLRSKNLNKNLVLRSMIQAWIVSNPIDAAPYRYTEAVIPPAHFEDAATGKVDEEDIPSLTNEASLGRVIQYCGACPRKTKAQRIATGEAPPPVHTPSGKVAYEFRCNPVSNANGLEIRALPASVWVPVPIRGATSAFLTPQGLVFFNPKDILETRVVVEGDDDGDGQESCKFKEKCTNTDCKYSHNFPCRFGVGCRDKAKCKLLHPDLSSVVPLGAAYPLNTACKYNAACTAKGCTFAHPIGRMGRIERAQKKIFATHNQDLTPLDSGPVPIEIGMAPPGSTAFCFQGEFVFFFTPYPGAWAKEHYKSVTVHRFDSKKTMTYHKVADYSLEGHYCNSAVGSHGFMVLSWWPFEDEAMRAIWESGRQIASQDKELQAAKKELETVKKASALALTAKDDALARSAQTIRALTAKQQAKDLAFRQRAEQQKAQRAQQINERLARIQRESAWKATRAAQARTRSERFRMRDPIHVYALDSGKNGSSESDWRLVLDYHKGAHALEVFAPSEGSGNQRLLVTENDQVFAFDLLQLTSNDVRNIGKLPIVPGRLCADF